MKTCFFGWASDFFFYRGNVIHFINSFKHFHPDIDLIVFRQEMVDKWIDFTLDRSGKSDYVANGQRKIAGNIAKPVFARLLTKKYDRIINIDCDTVVTGRLDAVLEDDWDVGGVWNYNSYENASVENVKEDMYIQAGMVGSKWPEFWDIWDKANQNAQKYLRFENDVLNLVIYNQIKNKKVKIFDKDQDYYGCKSLALEGEMYIENNELMLRGEKVRAYHHARGMVFPKLQYERMGFREEVTKWLYKISLSGPSLKYVAI